ncbi:hypothetical protein [Kordia sp.]|uniref:hypothetical protein n=1 Tax=Kordia sp. TaxID=1965332 RepID=UPI003D6A4449
MKTKLTTLVFLLISITMFAQQGINYKAILKDGSDNVLANTFMNIQFSIHQATAAGTIVYQEDHNYTTDANGLLILTIGTDSSPSVGTFATIDWSADLHFLQTTITYSGGTINFDATEFKAVPYAKHAKTAETAANVFSGDYNDLTNQPTTLPSGLEQYTDNEGRTGWNLIGMVQSPWIGTEAINLSHSVQVSPRTGALGLRSFAVGNSTTASGDYSTAMGYSTQANGLNSIAMGRFTYANGLFSTAIGYNLTAHSSYETVIGRNSTNYIANDPLDWDPDDRLFTIGNSPSNVTLSNALVVLKNGTITAPSFSIPEIDNAGNTALITKRYADANYLNISSNLVPIAYGTIESDGNVLSSTLNVTASINAGVITISVINVTMNVNNTSCTITPYSTAFRTSSIIISGGDIQVRTFDSSGNSAPTTFQFVIYKL